MQDTIRVGLISAVDAGGCARVYYPDQGETTAPLHLFAGHGEYALPQVGDQVLVLHLSNDTSTAVIMGRFWGMADPPPKEVQYRKQITPDSSATVNQGIYILRAPEIRFEGTAGSITLNELIDLKKRVEQIEQRERV